MHLLDTSVRMLQEATPNVGGQSRFVVTMTHARPLVHEEGLVRKTEKQTVTEWPFVSGITSRRVTMMTPTTKATAD